MMNRIKNTRNAAEAFNKVGITALWLGFSRERVGGGLEKRAVIKHPAEVLHFPTTGAAKKFIAKECRENWAVDLSNGVTVEHLRGLRMRNFVGRTAVLLPPSQSQPGFFVVEEGGEWELVPIKHVEAHVSKLIDLGVVLAGLEDQ